MVDFNDWCNFTDTKIGAHSLKLISADPLKINAGVISIANIVPIHYAAEERLANILKRLGKANAASFILEKLPTTKSIRSGDLGEILATEFIENDTEFNVPIKRLRWKDHRNMALRGDDVIGVSLNQANGSLKFLKSEVKSRVTLSSNVVSEARQALDTNGGLPSSHTLAYISDRLAETDNHELADAIIYAQLIQGIQANQVTHLLFTMTGNNPSKILTASLNNYPGNLAQLAVGLHIPSHADFVGTVYNLVISNANN